jgi:hypothetical protein
MKDGVYNCFGVYNTSMCYDCIFNEKSESKEKSNRFQSYKDAIDEFYKFLKGEELPEGTHCKTPKLSPDIAFTVIWFLQEHLHVLPDNVKQCDGCKELFDSHQEGVHLDDQYKNAKTGKTLAKKHWGSWCDSCTPDIDYELK